MRWRGAASWRWSAAWCAFSTPRHWPTWPRQRNETGRPIRRPARAMGRFVRGALRLGRQDHAIDHVDHAVGLLHVGDGDVDGAPALILEHDLVARIGRLELAAAER